ncbi:MAG: recombination protein RecR [Candidatus Tyloplasma litorale]|nr:MAG: recombination protein RecR [Mycoplasmatales bacterium]
MNNKLRNITELLRDLPGISLKNAERLAIKLVEDKSLLDILNKLNQEINLLKKDELTGLIIEKDAIANENKDKDLLIILESNKDLNNVLLKTNTNKSFFILDMENKRDFQNMEKLLERLFKCIKEYNPKEVLFLLSPSIESELVMRVVKEEMPKNFNQEKLPKLTRLSMGIPFGGSIEFSDERTIREAMKKREEA